MQEEIDFINSTIKPNIDTDKKLINYYFNNLACGNKSIVKILTLPDFISPKQIESYTRERDGMKVLIVSGIDILTNLSN
jgi:hypothetical protein